MPDKRKTNLIFPIMFFSVLLQLCRRPMTWNVQQRKKIFTYNEATVYLL